jgi:hypothetical protein
VSKTAHQPINPADIMAAREGDSGPLTHPRCFKCGEDWPCETFRLAEALQDSERELAAERERPDRRAERLKLLLIRECELRGSSVRRIAEERDRLTQALRDAQAKVRAGVALAEEWERQAAWYDSAPKANLGQEWTAIQAADELRDRASSVRAALAGEGAAEPIYCDCDVPGGKKHRPYCPMFGEGAVDQSRH